MKWFFDNAANFEAVAEIVLAIAAFVAAILTLALRKTTPSRTEMATAIATAIAAALAPIIEKLAAADRNALEALARVARVEGTIDRHATKDDVSEILQALERQDGDRRTLGAEVRGMREGYLRIAQQLDMLMQAELK